MTADSSNTPLPPLKSAVEAIPFEHKGQPMVMLRDLEGLNNSSIGMSPPAFMVALLLNGKNTLADVQSHFTKATGTVVRPEEIQQILKELEKGDLLEGPQLEAKRNKVLQDFLNDPIKKAMHVDAGYPGNQMELATVFGEYFQDPRGPKKQVPAGPTKPAALGLLAPHIDFARGGPAYAWAYQALGETAPPDLILALGVAHMSPNSPWVLTKKGYETPYGVMPVAEDLYKDVQDCLWYEGRQEEWVHRTEHSLEFQAVWLKYLWRDKTPPWVPVLCSSFDRFCTDKPPSAIPALEKGIQDLGAKLLARQKAGQRILILGGVDLAHVGPRFGDQLKLGPELEKRVETDDLKSLDPALKLDVDAYYMSVVADGHWRNWCGLSAIYTALRLISILSGKKSTTEPVGQLLTYGQAPDPMGGLVSFTSIIFPR